MTKAFHFFYKGRAGQYVAMYHIAGVLAIDAIGINGPVEILIIIFILVKRGKTGHLLPFFTDGKNAQAYVLAFTGQCKGIEVFRLAEFLCENDFVHCGKILNR